jgi:poly(3-hydroxybutyrate) depolymerase
MSRQLWDSGVETWRAATEGASTYWLGALTRGATPLDLADDALRWWEAMNDRDEPTWHSPNELVLESPTAALRDFSQGSRKQVTPTLVLPPQAGHHSCIVDYSSEQSQIETIRGAGLERVWAMEWVGADESTKHAGILDYIDFLERCVEEIGGPVNLIGDCQGGWLAAIYAALHPEQINTLTLAGSPIDFHVGEGPIHEWVKQLCASSDMAFYEGLVASGGGVLSGNYLVGGFIAIKPENELSKHLQLLNSLDDPTHLQRYADFEDWYKFTQDLPGDFYLWIVRELFRDNKLITGELEVGGQRIDLSKLKMPLNLLGGATDHITPPAQVFAAADVMKTPKRDVTMRTTSGGHLGLFMGREALREHWPPILAEVLEHSRARASKGRAERSARAKTPANRRTIAAP